MRLTMNTNRHSVAPMWTDESGTQPSLLARNLRPARLSGSHGIARSTWSAVDLPQRFVIAVLVLATASQYLAAADALNDHRYDSSRPLDLPFAMKLPETPTFPHRDFNLHDHGGVADGKTLNTRAFAAAIAACAQAGGGRVIVPAGRWLTGAIHLRSNVNLHLQAGSTVLFSTNPADYLPAVWVRWAGLECMNYSPLIYARDCENIAVTGRGTLDGQGARWWYWSRRQNETAQRLYHMSIAEVPVERRMFAKPEDSLRPQFIQPINCKHVLLEGVTIVSGPFWTVQFVYCDQVIARNLTIRTSGSNNDGINADSCRNVLIEGCDLSTGDDGICLKSGLNEEGRRIGRPTENVIIRHCVTRAGHGGFVIGSEMSGGIRNVLVYDCDFLGTASGVRLKSARGRGGVVENIWCRDIRMHNIAGEAIVLTTSYKAWFGSDQGVAPTFRNITFENIKVNVAVTGIAIDGLPEQAIENLTFRDLDLVARRGLRCTDARGLTLDRVFLNPYERTEVMTFTNTRDVTIKNCQHPEGAEAFVVAKGASTAGIRLVGNDLKLAKTPFTLDEGASAGAVKLETAGINPSR
jgi:polygalacturonase